MAEEIINRVANSKLVTIDLEDFYPKGTRKIIDIKDWLFQELILKEKDFRAFVDDHDWNQYKDSYVALHCSTDAIIPSWAYLLVSTRLAGVAKKTVVGDLELLESVLYNEVINALDITIYHDKPIIIKGCSNKPIPQSAYTFLIEKLLPVSKSLLFGEACSTVPLYKNKK